MNKWGTLGHWYHCDVRKKSRITCDLSWAGKAATEVGLAQNVAMGAGMAGDMAIRKQSILADWFLVALRNARFDFYWTGYFPPPHT